MVRVAPQGWVMVREPQRVLGWPGYRGIQNSITYKVLFGIKSQKFGKAFWPFHYCTTIFYSSKY